MSEREIEIRKVGESTKVTLSISTLSWIIGILLFTISTLATIGYFDIKDDQKTIKEKYETEKEEYKKEVIKAVQEELRPLRERNIKFTEDIGEIKGDIKVILDRTTRPNTNNSNNNHNSNIQPMLPSPTSSPSVER